MIAGNHHGAPEPHIWLLLTPGIDLWKAANRNGVPPEIFPAWQRTKVPRMFRYTRCSLKNESFIYIPI